jgi:hypothetical protein
MGSMPSWVIRQSSRAPLRVLVAALCLLFAAAPTLPGLHFLLIAHVVCPEHGELLHGSSSSAEPAASGRARLLHKRRSAELAWVAAPAPAHDSCGVPAWGNASGVACGALTAPPAALLPVEQLSAGIDRGAHRAIALLSYAPKLAPPLHWAAPLHRA